MESKFDKMKIILILFLAMFLTSCSNAAQGEEQRSAENATSQAVQSIDKEKPISDNTTDTAANLTSEDVNDHAEAGFRIMLEETLSGLAYGQDSSELIKILGEPEEKSEAIIWGVDEMEHQTWIYKSKGLEFDMIRNGETQSVDMITAKYPCPFKTKRNIGIGSTQEDVVNAYDSYINPEESNIEKGRIVVGSVYGGISFSIENNVVSRIFIGASAE